MSWWTVRKWMRTIRRRERGRRRIERCRTEMTTRREGTAAARASHPADRGDETRWLEGKGNDAKRWPAKAGRRGSCRFEVPIRLLIRAQEAML
jgi:hypothetical protein